MVKPETRDAVIALSTFIILWVKLVRVSTCYTAEAKLLVTVVLVL